MCFPWALARLLPSAVRVWIRSRSTSASPPNTDSIKRQVLVPVGRRGVGVSGIGEAEYPTSSEITKGEPIISTLS
jgi:hypothetical protein